MSLQNSCLKSTFKTVPVSESIGMVLCHDITEIRKDEFKGAAFRKGHIIKENDIDHLKRLGKEHVFAIKINKNEIHEDEAAIRIANALIGEGVRFQGEPKEGKINLVASYRGLLKIDKDRLMKLNMLGEIMCATLHNNTMVDKDQILAGTRAIPLIIKKATVEKAEKLLTTNKLKDSNKSPYKAVIEVKRLRKPKVGIVITGNEVYEGKVKDAFAQILTSKIKLFDGEFIGIHYSLDDVTHIEKNLLKLINAGSDLLITTGGMSVDPDDVTRFAIKKIGARDIIYGSSVLPGAMFLISYFDLKEKKITIPILALPACGMYHHITIFDLILPRVLANETITRSDIAELGHGGLCLNCKVCNFPVCPFGK